MASKEAKSILNEYRNKIYNSTFGDEVELAMAIDVILPKYVELEKRDIPMKVIKVSYSFVERDITMKVIKTQKWYYHCPKCKDKIDVSNVDFDSKQVYQYCHHCGQRLDWSDEND